MLRSLVVVCALFVLGAVLVAQENQPKASKTKSKVVAAKGRKPSSTTTPSKQEASSGGVVVFVDPVTRQIREATPADIGTLSTPTPPAAVAAPPQPQQIQGPGGAVGIVLGNEFEVHTVVTKAPDGTLRTEEVTGEKAAEGRVPSGATQTARDAK